MSKEVLELLIISFSISAVISYILSKYAGRFSKLADTLNKSHAVHHIPVPRIGGIGIFTSLVITSLLTNSSIIQKLLIFMSLVFIIGLIEDIKKDTSPKIRLFLLLLISAVITLNLNFYIKDIGFTKIPPFLSTILTIIAIAGFTNAVNIIDGLNGLASGISLTFLFFLGLSFYEIEAYDLSAFCYILIASIGGFIIFNFPKGKLFLGDGGSYLLGFTCAVLALELINLHNRISPWFPLLLGILPVWEVLFSAYRRKIKNKHPFYPDKLHLHTLIFNRVTRSNPKASILILTGNLIFSSLAFIFRYCTTCLILETLLFILIYTKLYKAIVKFQFQK